MAKYLYIDSDVRILTEEAARQALEKENDQQFLTEDQGVVRVSEERWKTAQKTERKHWMNLGVASDNDRNYEHFANFDGYRALQNRTFSSAVELGCGPFTNMRLIADVCHVKECTLLDPLIESYLTHPNCTYTKSALYLENTHAPLLARRIKRKINRDVPKLRKLTSGGHKVPIARLLPTAIEQMPTDNSYDLLTIINVIEHCYDVDAVFDKILAVLKPDGLLVFHEPLYRHMSVKDLVTTVYDAAHPLQVDQAVILSFLKSHFTPLFEFRSAHPNIIEGEDLSFEGIYFIGVRN